MANPMASNRDAPLPKEPEEMKKEILRLRGRVNHFSSQVDHLRAEIQRERTNGLELLKQRQILSYFSVSFRTLFLYLILSKNNF